MTVRSIGASSHVDLAPTTTAEIIASVQSQAQNDAAEASRDLRELGRALRTESQHSQIHELRQSAEQEMWSGVMQGIGTMAQGLGSVAGGAVGPGQEAQTVGGCGSALNGGLGIASAVFKRGAAEARAHATEAEHAAGTAGEVVQSARDDLEAAHQARERVTQALGEVIREQRRAEDAALRA